MGDYYAIITPFALGIFLWWGTGRLPIKWKFALSAFAPALVGVFVFAMMGLVYSHSVLNIIGGLIQAFLMIATLAGIGALLACSIEYAWKALRNRP